MVDEEVKKWLKVNSHIVRGRIIDYQTKNGKSIKCWIFLTKDKNVPEIRFEEVE